MNTIDKASGTAAGRRGRRAGVVGLALTALVSGGIVGATTPASAMPVSSAPVSSAAMSDNRDFSVLSVLGVRVSAPVSGPVSPPAVPGVPDVGLPGEVVRAEGLLTIDPYGNTVSSTGGKEWGAAGAGDVDGGVHAAGFKWTWVHGRVAGARIRTRPVNGAVIGLIPFNASYLIGCKQMASDGYAWGYASHNGRRGWVRSDLWTVDQFTGPGGNHQPNGPVPWC